MLTIILSVAIPMAPFLLIAIVVALPNIVRGK
jgi:hypothetical protein